MLFNLIEINNIIESADSDTQSAIAEYLLSKVENAAKEPQFLPQNISRLLISIPMSKEWNPILTSFVLLQCG